MNTRQVTFSPFGPHTFGYTVTQQFPVGITGDEADLAICRMYGKTRDDIQQSIWKLLGDGNNDGGGSALGAVVGAPFALFGWIGSSIKEGMDEAQEEEDYARECGGQVWEDYQAKQQKEQDQALALIGKTVKWGSVVAASIATVALWEITLPLALAGGTGYLIHKKNVNKNRPAKVQAQYRKEVL